MLVYHSFSTKCNNDWKVACGYYGSLGETFKTTDGWNCGTLMIPYGIYEPIINRGYVFVGTSHDTPEFAASSIAKWWRLGNRDYDDPGKLLILADGGDSNSSRSHAWKAFIQTYVADRFQIPVTVCHYPPGTSKWNPIEH